MMMVKGFFLSLLLADWIEKFFAFLTPFYQFQQRQQQHTPRINQSEIEKKRKTTTATRFTQERIVYVISDEEIAGINSGCQLFGIVWGWRENNKRKKSSSKQKTTKNPLVDFDFSADTFHFIPALQLARLTPVFCSWTFFSPSSGISTLYEVMDEFSTTLQCPSRSPPTQRTRRDV
jgi:hypothetical protein